jgi:hypothetical protein
MKTPMQQMHEFLCEELSKKESWRDYPHIENAILKCEELMKVEKEVIVKAVYDGMGKNFDPNMGRAELYYNETFD